MIVINVSSKKRRKKCIYTLTYIHLYIHNLKSKVFVGPKRREVGGFLCFVLFIYRDSNSGLYRVLTLYFYSVKYLGVSSLFRGSSFILSVCKGTRHR